MERAEIGDYVNVVIRLEDVYIGSGRVKCIVEDVMFLGRFYQTTLGDIRIKAEGPYVTRGEETYVEIVNAKAYR